MKVANFRDNTYVTLHPAPAAESISQSPSGTLFVTPNLNKSSELALIPRGAQAVSHTWELPVPAWTPGTITALAARRDDTAFIYYVGNGSAPAALLSLDVKDPGAQPTKIAAQRHTGQWEIEYSAYVDDTGIW